MEWMNRAGRPAQPANQTVVPSGASAPVPHHGGAKKKADKEGFSLYRLGLLALVFSLAILLIGVVVYVMTLRKQDESKFVDESRMQAIFLNGGQVYFGKIRALNNQYVGVTDIYYLRVNQQVQPNQQQNQNSQQDISLVKLGCELHGPQDQMLINREQVVFWENLKDDGQVAKAVAEYVKQNPNGQKCENNNQGTGGQNNQQQQQSTTPATNNSNNSNAQNNKP